MVDLMAIERARLFLCLSVETQTVSSSRLYVHTTVSTPYLESLRSRARAVLVSVLSSLSSETLRGPVVCGVRPPLVSLFFTPPRLEPTINSNTATHSPNQHTNRDREMKERTSCIIGGRE